MYLDWSYWTELELVRPQLQWWGSESALRSLRGCWDSSWCWARSTHSQSWVCDKTKVAGIGTVVLQNRLADSEAGGSWAGLSDTAQHQWIQWRILFKKHYIFHDTHHFIYRHDFQYDLSHEKAKSHDIWHGFTKTMNSEIPRSVLSKNSYQNSKAEVCSSFAITIVREQHPRSHHKGTISLQTHPAVRVGFKLVTNCILSMPTRTRNHIWIHIFMNSWKKNMILGAPRNILLILNFLYINLYMNSYSHT